MRICRAKIPEKYVIETFPFANQPKLARKNNEHIWFWLYVKKSEYHLGGINRDRKDWSCHFIFNAGNKSGLQRPFYPVCRACGNAVSVGCWSYRGKDDKYVCQLRLLADRRDRIRRGWGWACSGEIGRAHVWTPVTLIYLVCRLLLEKKKKKIWKCV